MRLNWMQPAKVTSEHETARPSEVQVELSTDLSGLQEEMGPSIGTDSGSLSIRIDYGTMGKGLLSQPP